MTNNLRAEAGEDTDITLIDRLSWLNWLYHVLSRTFDTKIILCIIKIN